MSIRIKLKPNKKAMVKFTDRMDAEFFTWLIRIHRDDGKTHPQISIKDMKDKELLPIPNQPPMPSPIAKHEQIKIVEPENVKPLEVKK